MDKGTCWQCKNLSVTKDEGEIFWHYRCQKNPNRGEMDPSKFIYYERCFEQKKMNYDDPADVNIEWEKIKDSDAWINTVLKYRK